MTAEEMKETEQVGSNGFVLEYNMVRSFFLMRGTMFGKKTKRHVSKNT